MTKAKQRFYIPAFLILFVSAFVLSGCADDTDKNSWRNTDAAFAYKKWTYQKDQKEEILHIYRLKQAKFNVELLNSSEKPMYVSDWFYNNDYAVVVINGAYFHKDFSPSGFLKIDSERIGERLFNQDLSGLVQIDEGKLTIRDLQENPLQQGENIENGLQSYPFLIQNSLPAITEDSGKIARRTAIGIDKNENTYIIIADTTLISLYELMNQMIATGIPFTDVLNLDGGTSTGIAVAYGSFRELKDSMVKVPSVILFEKN